MEVAAFVSTLVAKLCNYVPQIGFLERIEPPWNGGDVVRLPCVLPIERLRGIRA
jgi:hypothetical protein